MAAACAGAASTIALAEASKGSGEASNSSSNDPLRLQEGRQRFQQEVKRRSEKREQLLKIFNENASVQRVIRLPIRILDHVACLVQQRAAERAAFHDAAGFPQGARQWLSQRSSLARILRAG